MSEGFWQKAKQIMGLEAEEGGGIQVEKEEESGRILRFKPIKKANEEVDYEIDMCEAKVYEDSLSISYKLRQGVPVIINLRSLEQAEGTRLIDFVCGAAYAVNGHMLKIADSIFLFTPANIAIVDLGEKSSVGEGLNLADREREKFFGNR